MPTVLRIGPYRFFFYSSNGLEPEHIHVEREKKCAKFWLSPVRLQRTAGFSRVELNELERLVTDNRDLFLESWHEYFGN